MAKYVWYVGYGSNLDKQRFLCYISGGFPDFSLKKKKHDGCTDKTVPGHPVKHITIPYRLYFAWSRKMKPPLNWGNGGVAFIDTKVESNMNYWSQCRMWKITCEQYEEVRDDEGRSLYNQEIYLEEQDGIPIRTITYGIVSRDILEPSDRYLKTIARGLRETFSFDANAFVNYLKDKEGIRENINEEKLREIFISINDL